MPYDHRHDFITAHLRPVSGSEVILSTEERASTRGIDALRQRHLRAAFSHVRMAAIPFGRTVGATGGAHEMYFEFGVRNAVGINYLASLAPHVTWHGFDSFEGLPGTASKMAKRKLGWGRAAYSTHGQLPKVAANVELHRGWFNESLPVFLDAALTARGSEARTAELGPRRAGKAHRRIHRRARVVFAHLDADLYSSTISVLDALASRCLLHNGTVLAFDELFGRPALVQEEWRALQEATERWKLSWRFVSWMLHPKVSLGQAAVQITAVGSICKGR
jgi:hypothetical protein